MLVGGLSKRRLQEFAAQRNQTFRRAADNDKFNVLALQTKLFKSKFRSHQRCAANRRQPDDSSFKHLGRFDLRLAHENKIEGRHTSGHVNQIRASEIAFDHDGTRSLNKFQFSGKQSHDSDGGSSAD